jgi:hypothetical protein
MKMLKSRFFVVLVMLLVTISSFAETITVKMSPRGPNAAVAAVGHRGAAYLLKHTAGKKAGQYIKGSETRRLQGWFTLDTEEAAKLDPLLARKFAADERKAYKDKPLNAEQLAACGSCAAKQQLAKANEIIGHLQNELSSAQSTIVTLKEAAEKKDQTISYFKNRAETAESQLAKLKNWGVFLLGLCLLLLIMGGVTLAVIKGFGQKKDQSFFQDSVEAQGLNNEKNEVHEAPIDGQGDRSTARIISPASHGL